MSSDPTLVWNTILKKKKNKTAPLSSELGWSGEKNWTGKQETQSQILGSILTSCVILGKGLKFFVFSFIKWSFGSGYS